MPTTPTVGNEVPFSNFFTDFSPKVKALHDGTFAIVWQRDGGDIVGRHFNELGGFTGGDFLAALSGSTTKALTDPQLYQQADGQIAVDYNEQFDAIQRDVRWHEVDRAAPNAGSVGMEVLPTVDEFLFDSTNLPEIGSAHVFGADNGRGKFFILRFADLNGTPISDRIHLDLSNNKDELNAAVAANLNGVAVAYEQFDKTTFDRQINLQVVQYNGAPLSGVVPVSGPGANAAFPDMTTLNNGSYVVTWQQAGGTAFRNYNGNGIPLDAAPVIIPNSGGLRAEDHGAQGRRLHHCMDGRGRHGERRLAGTRHLPAAVRQRWQRGRQPGASQQAGRSGVRSLQARASRPWPTAA